MEPTPATTPPATAAKRDAQPHGNFKETVESILIAFVLAFVFRAFVVEAFVIPTGSMAPTLLGAHASYVCPDCGMDYDVNYSARSDDQQNTSDLNIPSVSNQPHVAVCPNCAYQIPYEATPDNPRPPALRPRIHFGDRILVLKYLYLFEDPSRWDVVVFKSPAIPDGDIPTFEDNYIKRLIGRPNESIMILDGDIYVAPRAADGNELKPSDFTVQTKPDVAQQSLWRLMYHNDYIPRGLNRGSPRAAWQQPWETAGTGWKRPEKVDDSRAFSFDNLESTGTLSFNREANPIRIARPNDRMLLSQSFPMTDWLAYNADVAPHQISDQVPASDLKLDLFYARAAGDGPLHLKLTKRNVTFTAELLPNRVRLLKQDGNHAPVTIGEVEFDGHTTRSRQIEFANVDYRVTLRIDGKLLLETTPADYAPDVEALINEAEARRVPPYAQVAIEAQRQQSKIEHLSLYRDVHYTIRSRHDIPQGSPINFPDRVANLGPKEYFVMGDNSSLSWDSRFWVNNVDLPGENLFSGPGIVPDRFMLGKAFFVYWPASYSPGGNLPPLVPNFGDMRLIK